MVTRRPKSPVRVRPPVGRVPTRKHPGLDSSDSPAARQVRSEIGRLLGATHPMPLARVRSVNVFALRGEAGSGLLAERDERLDDEPGVYRTTGSILLPERRGQPARVLELLTHSWDAATYASDTGDRTWVEVSRPRMYAERDRRTAALAERLDQVTGFELPPGGVPALNAGLTPDEVARLAEAIR